MKRSLIIIITSIAIFNCHNSYSQTEKGNILLGGSIGFSDESNGYVDQPKTKVFNLEFNPNISYFIIDRLSIGAIIPLNIRKGEIQDQSRKTTQFSIGPVLRYYIPLGEFSLFPEISYTIGQLRSNDQGILDTGTGQFAIQDAVARVANLKTGVGLTYFLSNQIGIEGIFSYQRTITDYDNSDFADLELSNINFNVGLQIYFHPRKSD